MDMKVSMVYMLWIVWRWLNAVTMSCTKQPSIERRAASAVALTASVRAFPAASMVRQEERAHRLPCCSGVVRSHRRPHERAREPPLF